MPEARIAAILGYAELIDRRRREPADPERDGYCERHHALPKSMGGAEGDNLVLLPVREHIEAHILLAEAVGDQEFGRGMSFAALFMTHGRYGEFASIEEAAEARELASQAARNPSLATRAKISAASRGRPGWFRGKSHSMETRAKMSEAKRGVPLSEAHRATLRGRKLAPRSEAHRAALSAGRRGKLTGQDNPSFNPEPLTFECIATGERFDLTRQQAIEKLGIPASKISALIAGRRRKSVGFRLVRTEQEAA